jgi:four helix bundle protein
VLQELDETDYWLEIAVEHKLLPARRLEPLRKEVNELIAIFVACVRKLYRLKKPRRSRIESPGRTEG